MKLLTLAAAAAALMCASCAGSGDGKGAAADSADTTAVTLPADASALPDTVVVATDDALLRPDAKVDALTVLDFNAVWCVPCKKLTEPMERAANKYAGSVVFYSVDFENLPQTATAFDITTVPVVILQKPDGTMVRIEGISDFISSEQQKSLSKEEAADVIFDNLCQLIDNNL